jgi:dipeptidyl aminopeptidase/acylaminoacyl peptidase
MGGASRAGALLSSNVRRQELTMVRLLAACAVFGLATASIAAELHTDPRFLQPRDVFDLEWADNPAVSPDGKRVVYQRNQFDVMKDRRRSHLWLLEADGTRHRPLTSGNVGDGAAVWSPDGDRLAWVSAREGASQIWVRWMDTGQSAVLTQFAASPGDLSWSPDGRQIAFIMHVPADTKPLAKMPAKPKGAEWAPDVKLIDRIGYRADGAGYLEPGYTHVFVVPAEGGTPRQVTQGDFQHRGRPVWSRDGRSLFVVANRNADWEYDPIDSEIHRVDVATGAATALTSRDGPDAAPALSPDGKRLAYVGFDDRKLGYHQSQLHVLDLASGASRVLTADFDHDVDSPAWDRDGGGIFFGYERHGKGHIGWIDADGGAVRDLTSDFGGTAMGRPYGGGNFSVANGRVAFTHGTAERPAEIALMTRSEKPRVMTDLNSDLLARKRQGTVEEFWVKSADGLDVQGWIVKPPQFEEGKKYPLLLEIHGGPYQNYGPRFAPEIQLYASAGYVVVYTNPRGSTSYGQAFADQIQHNYPSRDYDDLMASVDEVISRGYIDTGRLYVTGGSGGGVLTAWIIGHTERFRAAVVAKPVINWTSHALTADGYVFFTQYWFPAPPWEAQEQYWKRSPLAHVGKVRTPTMLITGESDLRTPISESEQYYQALKLLRVDTAMVRIPGASHGINARPSNMIAQVLNTLAWFERYPAKVATPGAP